MSIALPATCAPEEGAVVLVGAMAEGLAIDGDKIA